MKEAKTSPEVRGYCTQCKSDFYFSRGLIIECDNGHQLAKSFPYDTFWNYCCGCDSFYSSNGLEGKEAESDCPCCERRITRRFFCNTCNVITVEAGDSESRRRPVEFSRGHVDGSIGGSYDTPCRTLTVISTKIYGGRTV